MPGPVILIFSPPVSQVRPAWRAYVLLLLLSSFSSSSSFNDRLEWSNEMISEPNSTYTRPIFTKFSGLVLGRQSAFCHLVLVSRSLKGRFHGNQF